MRRAVIRLLEDTFSEEFLSEKIKEDDTAVVDVNDQGKVYEERYGLPNQNSKNSVSAPVVTLSKDLQGVPLASLSPIS
jgi:hypothetical protein